MTNTQPIFRSDVTVLPIAVTASDAMVVAAAKVSTQASKAIEAMEMVVNPNFINFLMRDRHGSPFEHTFFTFYIEAPIFTFREFMRHRIASYNEESGRYKQLANVFYIPGEDRKLVQEGKPGAYHYVAGNVDQIDTTRATHAYVATEAYKEYQKLLDMGVAREVARMSLPLNIYSSMFVSMNARALMNFLSLRTKSEASHFPSFPQREIEMVAEKMESHFADAMPVTYRAFNANGRVAP